MRPDDNEEPVLDSTPERRPGEELARAREQAGIGLRAMADTLHLPENQLRALESDDYDSLPPPTFVRGYLRSYARVLGLDDDDIVAAYDAIGSASEDPKLHLSGGREANAHRRGLALSLTALALVVAVSVGGWWWQSRATGSAVAPPADVEDPAAESTAAANESTATAGDSTTAQDTEESGTAAADSTAEEASAAEGASAGEDGAAPEASASADEDASATDEPSAGDEAQPALALVDEAGLSRDNVSEPRSEPAASEIDSAAETFGTEGAADSDTDGGASANRASADQASGDQVGADRTASDQAETQAGTEQASAQQATAPGETDVASGSDAASESEPQAETLSYDPPAATASAEAATAPQAAEGPELLQIDLDGRSWLEIYDARGRELVYTLYSGSEPLQLRGWPPFDVFLGNSPAVEVSFNGDAVEKSAFTRSDNTARFLVDSDGARRR